jgi:F-type H+-transporting ATPase subunit delta
MFAAERWARAFVNISEDGNSDASCKQSDLGLAVLKAAFHCLSHVQGRVSGSAAAAQFNGFLQEALKKAGYDRQDCGVEAARGIIFLLIQRGYYPQNRHLIDEIEDVLEEKKRIVAVVLDCAHKPDESFLSALEEKLKTKTGAAKVVITVQLMPDLIGGYRVNIGNEREDFSLAGQLKQLGEALRGYT